jgi:hypothetical protein
MNLLHTINWVTLHCDCGYIKEGGPCKTRIADEKLPSVVLIGNRGGRRDPRKCGVRILNSSLL